MRTLSLDVRVALRFFNRRRAATGAIVMTLALVLAANSAAFAVLRAFLLSEMGTPDADRLHVVSQTQSGAGFLDAWPNYVMMRDQVKAFESSSAVLAADVNWQLDVETRQLRGARASAGFFKTMGVSPALGREIADTEQGPQAAPVVVISDRVWRIAFSRSPDVLGRSMRLNGVPHQVIGVMPEGFSLPPDVDAWLPFDLPQDQWTRVVGARQLFVFARLVPGVTNTEVQAQLVAFGKVAEAANLSNKGWSYSSLPVRQYYLSGADGTILLVQGGALVLLLLAAANLSSLLLAWAGERERETVMRLALGASDRDIARQQAIQSVLLMLSGGGVGLALTLAALPALRQLNPTPTLSFFLNHLQVDSGVVAFTLFMALAGGMLVSLVPLWQTRRSDLVTALRSESRGASASRGALRWQKAMAVTQSAVTVLVVSTAALSIASFQNASRAGTGYRTEDRAVLRVQLPDSAYPGAPERAAFVRAFTENLAREREISAFGVTSTLPAADLPAGSALIVEQKNGEFTTEPRIFGFRRVSVGYLDTMGIPLLRGRQLTLDDEKPGAIAAVISKSLADRYWRDSDPIGRRFRRLIPGQPTLEFNIVGVVGTVRDTGNAEAAKFGESIYIPYAQNAQRKFSVVVQSRGSIERAVGAAVHALRATDPGVAAYDVTTLQAVANQTDATARLQMVLLSLFAAVAVGVALLGSYGVMSQLAAHRAREMAVRLAMGDDPRGVLRRVLSQNARLAGTGVVLGGVVAWQGGRFLQQLVTGVDARSPWTYLAVAGVTLLMIQTVSLVPARRLAAADVLKGLSAE